MLYNAYEVLKRVQARGQNCLRGRVEMLYNAYEVLKQPHQQTPDWDNR